MRSVCNHTVGNCWRFLRIGQITVRNGTNRLSKKRNRCERRKEVQDSLEQHEENVLQAETLEGSTALENTIGLVAAPSFALGAEVLQLLLVGVQHATVRARLAELPVSQVERLVPSLQQVDLRMMEERVSIAVSVLRTQEPIPRKEYFLFITQHYSLV